MIMNNNERTCLRVIVPPNAGPGRELIVQTPEGRLVSAIVPKGHQAGSTFLVNYPPPPPPPPRSALQQQRQQQQNQNQNQNHHKMKMNMKNGKMMMMDSNSNNNSNSRSSQGQTHQQQHQQRQHQEQEQEQQQQVVQPPSSLLKIKVPKGKRQGDRFKVRLDDGQTIEATVPNNNLKEFYLDVSGTATENAKRKRKQNWHENPLAVLPMTIGPFL